MADTQIQKATRGADAATRPQLYPCREIVCAVSASNADTTSSARTTRAGRGSRGSKTPGRRSGRNLGLVALLVPGVGVPGTIAVKVPCWRKVQADGDAFLVAQHPNQNLVRLAGIEP